MAQRSHIIDVTKSYVPISPDSMVENLLNTDREDGEEKAPPIVPYAGYNFLPTAYGYRSYFGLNAKLDITSLPSRTQFIISYQLPTYQTRFIALCEDGIWLANLNNVGSAWTHAVTITFDPAILKEWTYCIIENTLYMYSQGGAFVYKTNVTALLELEILNFAPSFLNMAGQLGIFKAGTRLGFWDSANSVAWSSNLDLTDFTPSLEYLTGNTIFGDVIGRIITVKGHKDGYIVYATRSITGVSFAQQGTLLWEAKNIFSTVGISHSRAVVVGQSDGEHFAYTTNGIYRFGEYTAITNSFKIDEIATDFYDFIRETRDPIYLDIIGSRYLFFHCIDPASIYSGLEFTHVQGESLVLRIGGKPWTLEPLPAVMSGNAMAQAIKQILTYEIGGGITRFYDIGFTIAQNLTDSPLNRVEHLGPFDRGSAELGFTAEDILDMYIEGTSLPDEVDPEDVYAFETLSPIIGIRPAVPFTIVEASADDLIALIQKQYYDWALQIKHQQAVVSTLNGLTKVKPVVLGTEVIGETVAGLAPPPPPPLVQYTTIGNYITGEGNTVFSKSEPTERFKIGIKKYYQRKFTVKRKKVTTYTHRVNPDPATFVRRWPGWTGYNIRWDTFYTAAYTDIVIPSSPDGTASVDVEITRALAAFNSFPADLSAYGSPAVKEDYYYSYPPYYPTSNSYITVVVRYRTIEGDVYTPRVNVDINPTVTRIYHLDYQTTYSYEVTLHDADMGSARFEATQSETASVVLIPTLSPPTYTMDGRVDTFGTIPDLIYPLAEGWDGVETFQFLQSKSQSPWRVDGTFGNEQWGSPIPGYNPATDAPADVGSLIVYGDSFIIEYPPSSYVLQAGVPFLSYPTFEGSYVLDLLLKKWGKHKNQFTVLGSVDSINQEFDAALTTKDKGMNAFLKVPNNELRVFDEYPTDSILRYGKIGLSRLGFTNMLEVKAFLRSAGLCSVDVEASLNGISITDVYTGAPSPDRLIQLYLDKSARWFNIVIKGSYDMAGLEARTAYSGRR